MGVAIGAAALRGDTEFVSRGRETPWSLAPRAVSSLDVASWARGEPLALSNDPVASLGLGSRFWGDGRR